MAEYINREAFKRKLIDEKGFFPAIVARALDEMPTADVVEVVRCRDCIYREQLNDRIMCRRSAHKSDSGCWFGLRATANEHFCSYGKRKD